MKINPTSVSDGESYMNINWFIRTDPTSSSHFTFVDTMFRTSTKFIVLTINDENDIFYLNENDEYSLSYIQE